MTFKYLYDSFINERAYVFTLVLQIRMLNKQKLVFEVDISNLTMGEKSSEGLFSMHHVCCLF